MVKQRRNLSSALAAIIVASGLAVSLAGRLAAQDRPDINQEIEGIKWAVLQQVALAGMPEKDEIMGIAEIAPGAAAERHTHADHELGYMLQGQLVLEVTGESPRTVSAGDSFAIPAGRTHYAKNAGREPAKALVIYIVDQGRPLAEPAN